MSKRQVHRAADAARRRLALTHFVRADDPSAGSSRAQRAVCGAVVAPHHVVTGGAVPTCDDCRRWINEYDALAIS